jgi:predicted Abi (CAAX) family protease
LGRKLTETAAAEEFVVQAIAPFHLFDLRADRVITGEKATLKYINFDYWKNTRHQKGQVITCSAAPPG